MFSKKAGKFLTTIKLFLFVVLISHEFECIHLATSNAVGVIQVVCVAHKLLAKLAKSGTDAAIAAGKLYRFVVHTATNIDPMRKHGS